MLMCDRGDRAYIWPDLFRPPPAIPLLRSRISAEVRTGGELNVHPQCALSCAPPAIERFPDRASAVGRARASLVSQRMGEAAN